MNRKNIFVLVIQRDPAQTALIRHALGQLGNGSFKLQCLENMPTAMARIGGGGIDVILLDLSVHDDRSSDAMTGFRQIHHAAPRVPIIVLYDHPDEGNALRAMHEGATDYVRKEGCGDDGSLSLRSAIELAFKKTSPGSFKMAVAAPTAGTISFIGAKGGVGATTVALNVASALAGRGKVVILVEMRPTFGSLLPYFKPYGPVRNITHLLRADGMEISPTEAAACLRPCKGVPGLNILYGPQLAPECGDLAPDRVKKLIKALAGLAEYVVVDLPSSLSDANRAVAEVSGRLALVLERDPVCVQAAKLMARSMETWVGTPQPVETILVNRALLSCPMPLEEIETQLGYPIFGVVPPGPEICLSAQHVHMPLIAFHPDHLLSDCLIALAGKCASFMRPSVAAG